MKIGELKEYLLNNKVDLEQRFKDHDPKATAKVQPIV